MIAGFDGISSGEKDLGNENVQAELAFMTVFILRPLEKEPILCPNVSQLQTFFSSRNGPVEKAIRSYRGGKGRKDPETREKVPETRWSENYPWEIQDPGSSNFEEERIQTGGKTGQSLYYRAISIFITNITATDHWKQKYLWTTRSSRKTNPSPAFGDAGFQNMIVWPASPERFSERPSYKYPSYKGQKKTWRNIPEKTKCSVRTSVGKDEIELLMIVDTGEMMIWTECNTQKLNEREVTELFTVEYTLPFHLYRILKENWKTEKCYGSFEGCDPRRFYYQCINAVPWRNIDELERQKTGKSYTGSIGCTRTTLDGSCVSNIDRHSPSGAENMLWRLAAGSQQGQSQICYGALQKAAITDAIQWRNTGSGKWKALWTDPEEKDLWGHFMGGPRSRTTCRRMFFNLVWEHLRP